MSILVLLAVVAFGWAVRRSIGLRTERSMIVRLPLGEDGVIEGAGAIVRTGSPHRAVLILHGFGDTPQTLGYLTDHLHDLGFTVHAPVLPGHARTLEEFAGTSGDAWLDAAAREFAEVRTAFDFVGLVGVSMGGALSVIIAAGSRRTAPDGARSAAGAGSSLPVAGHGPDSLVLLAPYLSMRPRVRRLAALHWVLSPFAKYLTSREEGSIRDPIERARNLGFGIVPPRMLHELRRIVERAQQALPAVRQPTLFIQSRNDNRIEAAAAERSYERLGSSEKRLVWMEGGGHVITVDTGRARVLTLTGEWLLEQAGKAGAHPPPSTPSRRPTIP